MNSFGIKINRAPFNIITSLIPIATAPTLHNRHFIIVICIDTGVTSTVPREEDKAEQYPRNSTEDYNLDPTS